MVVHTREMLVEHFGFKNTTKHYKNVYKLLEKLATPKAAKSLFCYSYERSGDNGWGLYVLETEFKRQGINVKHWRVQRVNEAFKVCETYPAKFIAPIGIQEADVFGISQARNKGRIPVLSWVNPNGASLIRCSQLNVFEDDMTGISGLDSKGDLKYAAKLLEIAGPERRPLIVHTGKQEELNLDLYKESYHEFDFYFGEIGNTEVMVRAIDKLRELCLGSELPPSVAQWREALEATRWNYHLHKILATATHVARQLYEHSRIVMVQNDHGADAVTQVSFLAQLLVDPFYRTVRGFGLLIEKEFVSFGHRFANFNKKLVRGEDTMSVIFVQTMDCVYQIMQQHPLFFEFTEELLLLVLDAVYSCQFGNFVYSCEAQRAAGNMREKTHSLWAVVLEDEQRYSSQVYVEYPSVLPLRTEKEVLCLWNGFYLRHKCRSVLASALRSITTAAAKGFQSLELCTLNLPLVPEQAFAKLSHIHSLDLSNNLLTGLPAAVVLLPHLRRLRLSSNMIPFISTDLLNMIANKVHELHELDLSDNLLVYLPSEIARLANLRSLSLAGNRLRQLPADLTGLAFLESLNLADNQLESLPESIFSTTTLRYLNASRNNLTDFPAGGLARLTGLTALDFSGNRFAQLPPEVVTLQHLTELGFGGNSISPIPPEVMGLTRLTRLSISHMGLTELPDSISNLQQLEYLDASHNKLALIPDAVLRLVQLRELHLAANEITAMPLDISNLTALEQLELQNNRLTSISPGVGKLDNLSLFDVSNNDIRHIPATVGYLTKLNQSHQFFFKGNNKLRTPPKPIVEAGLSEVFVYLKSLLEGAKRCYRMKIMVVGQENVGKTSLLRCLTKKTHVDEELKKATNLDSVSTDGIDIGKLTVYGNFPPDDDDGGATLSSSAPSNLSSPSVVPSMTSSSSSSSLIPPMTSSSSTSSLLGTSGSLKAKAEPPRTKVTLSVWDFAGQEIYYTTHQFFLSDRAVYLLVWNMAKAEEDSRVEYWLKSIETRAPKAPVILVGSHLDDKVCTPEYVDDLVEAMRNKYMQRFPNIQSIIPISCSTKKGINEVRLWLETVVLAQPHMGELIPTSYLELEKLAQDQGRVLLPPTKTWEEFETMGAICNIKDKERLANASRLLHALGSIVHFEKDKSLSDLVILNPQWLVDVMSTVITTKHQFTRNGVLQHVTLPQIWRPPEFPPEVHPVLLHLLEKFEISYYLRSTGTLGDPYTGRSLIPSLLPEERPADLEQHFSRFPAASEQQFGRQFLFSFIPHGFVSRLMVRLLHFADPTCFWRYGILLELDRQRILVEANVASKRVDITLRGPGTGKLSQLVIETTNALIDGWYKMNVDVRVPCIHCVRERMYDPYLFTLEECEAAAIAGHTFVRCSGVRDIRLDVVTPDIAMTHVQNCRIEYNDIEMGKKIGEGGFADVFRSIYKGDIVAVKRIKFGAKNQPSLDDTNELEAFGEFRREVWIMSGIVHQNCVQLTGFTMDPFCIVTEFLHHGNMYDLLHNNDFDLTPAYRWRMMHDIAKGMAFLHGTEPPIIHRDLKSPNVLMASLDPAAPAVAKVADFGLSQALASTTSGRSVANPVWLAPEIMKREEYTEKADVYSYGVMLWEAATRKNYFGEISFMSAIENRVIDGQRPPIPDDCHPALRRLIESCWAGNPDQRPSFATVKQDILTVIQAEHPELAAISAAEKAGDELRPPREVTAEQLERERLKQIEEEELLRREQELRKANTDEIARCMVELKPIQTSTVQCLIFVPDCPGKPAQIWCGTSSGDISIWDATV